MVQTKLITEIYDSKMEFEIPFFRDLVYHVGVINTVESEDEHFALIWVYQKAKDLMEGWNKNNSDHILKIDNSDPHSHFTLATISDPEMILIRITELAYNRKKE